MPELTEEVSTNMNQATTTQADGLVGTTAIVTGASRGFGRAIATALSAAGAQVVGVARTGARLEEVRRELGPTFIPVVADSADPATAARVIDEYQPRTLVLSAGSTPQMSPLQEQTWETFSSNWNVDVAQAFHWVRHALRRPLAPGSSVIVMSSGAALNGSPLSGGYAGAKATVRFITGYAAEEADRAALGISFVSVLPRLTPLTDLGAKAVAAYAERQGVSADTFVRTGPPPLSAEQVGKSVLEIAGRGPGQHGAYLLTGSGLSSLN
jgi:NAD(P)-dependent dehydrogenase (short-subunit alcohol dehydrogenase family)